MDAHTKYAIEHFASTCGTRDPLFRKFVGDNKTYYVNTEVLNAADHVLVDTRNPDSRGYGGSTFSIRTKDSRDTVKGPWHGTCPYEVFDVSELHFTKVTILANAVTIPYDEWTALQEQGMDVPIPHMKGTVLYHEDRPVLGHFHRGGRIAQQLADLRQETLFVHTESNGGSHSRHCKPGDKLHPLAHRTRPSERLKP